MALKFTISPHPMRFHSDLKMQGMHLREVNAHDACSRHKSLHGRRQGAEVRPYCSTVTVRFGVEEDDGRERGEGGGGRGGQAETAEVKVTEAAALCQR
jgi:hypothetical protein